MKDILKQQEALIDNAIAIGEKFISENKEHIIELDLFLRVKSIIPELTHFPIDEFSVSIETVRKDNPDELSEPSLMFMIHYDESKSLESIKDSSFNTKEELMNFLTNSVNSVD